MHDPSTAAVDPVAASRRSVLISGASFAGLATAFWMARLGYAVTVVEIAPGLRRGGTPVDIEGETIILLGRMGLIDAVRAKALPPRAFAFKSADDATLGMMQHDPVDAATPSRFEIHRDDLLEILFDAVSGRVDIQFGRSISAIVPMPDRVAVTFDDETQREFTLLVGCDGNRSATRRLAFAEDDGASYFMGGYFYLKVVAETGLLPPHQSQVFSVAGRTAMLNGYDDRTDVALAFRTTQPIDYDYRDRASQRRLILDRFAGLGWKVPAMLAHVADGDDFYFDQASQIRMPRWSNGRIVLVGDAGYCVSPVAGMGGSMALIGAGRLGEALQRFPDDPSAAFRHYETNLRPFVEDVQERAAATGMAMLFPADAEQLAARDRRLERGDLPV